VEETGGYLPGTFAAAVARLDYLKALGVTTLELLPVSEFNEVEMSPLDELEQLRGDEDVGRVRRVNVWGYVPLQAAAFAVMGRYGETVGSASYELKLLVRELHRRGMECVLDVVYNHVAGASCSLHFLDAEKEYFIVDENRNHSNISGCGNTTSPNAPCMTALVLESLRWLVTEYRVDGFRIDAAGVLAREVDGKPGGKGPFALLQAIAGDPVLSRRVKFIVEPWDAGDGVGSPNYLNGNYPLRTALEWNPDFGRAMRWFVFRGGDAEKGKEFARGFCKALRGSQRMYGSRPYGSAHSVNYLSCHDGFSLADSASYAKQTNVDGYADPTVCCHGAEGPTDDAEIVELRSRQLRNLVLASALARGIPMISQGCEGGISKGGNNNCYDVDGPPNWLSSDFETTPLTSFVRQALSFRRSRKELRGLDFYDDLEWRTRSGGVRNRPDSRSNHRKNAHPSRETGHGFVAWTVGDLYVAFNASSREVKAVLPSRSAAGVATETRLWRKVCDTFERAGGLYFRDVPSGDASRRENIVEEVSNPDEGTPSIRIVANSAVVYEWN
jgi:isoamylase